MFSKLVLERFLMELPQEISAYYHSLLFNRKTQRLFNEEMLYTIEMFFKKDLNLSDTARQLYIHRNTLVYRLDKVQRQTGLDLRKFEDAVTFKILMELKNAAVIRSRGSELCRRKRSVKHEKRKADPSAGVGGMHGRRLCVSPIADHDA